jgi:glycosyltransferase involved in cell wall biosynthesis
VGVLPRDALSRIYAAADVFVFPSHADTFGLVMLEAMACGTPVGAFPVDGPLEVLGRRDDAGRTLGGAMHEDLLHACRAAMAVPRAEARARALDFSWAHAAALFAQFLVPARAARGTAPDGQAPVTQLSSRSGTLS